MLLKWHVLQTSLQGKVTGAERDVDAARALTSRLAELKADIDEKRARLARAQAEFKSAGFEEKIREAMSQSSKLNDLRDELNEELRTLSLQADSRAKLDLQRAQMKTKTGEIKTT